MRNLVYLKVSILQVLYYAFISLSIHFVQTLSFQSCSRKLYFPKRSDVSTAPRSRCSTTIFAFICSMYTQTTCAQWAKNGKIVQYIINSKINFFLKNFFLQSALCGGPLSSRSIRKYFKKPLILVP